MDDFFDMPQLNFDSLTIPQDAGLTSAGPQQARKQTAYDPKALLDPKAAATRANDNEDDDNFRNGDLGTGSMIEKLNGVTNRQDAPGSKRKSHASDDDDDLDEERKKQKNSGFRPGAGGIIGDHLKNERAQLAPAETIDLTNDDDDEVQLIRENQASLNQEVCLGTIKAIATVYRIPHVRMLSKDMWAPFRAELQQGRADTKIIELIDRQGNKFGSVESKMAAAMMPLLQATALNKTRFRIFVPARVKKNDEYAGKKVSVGLPIDVLFYAPRNKAEALGRYLSQKQLFLANPSMETSMEIFNPQVPQIYGLVKTVARKPQHSSIQRSAEEIRQETSNMFDNLAKAEDLPEMAATTTIIKSELMGHQKQALNFLMEHERNDYEGTEMPAHSLWKYRSRGNGQPAWYHIITGTEVVEKPDQMQGGILADVMGLGKTLSILSLIAETRDAAQAFRREKPPQDIDAVMNAQGTLIICPKSVLSNWQEQIKTHTVEGTLKVHTYHGNSRNQDLKLFSKHDIVLTSYNTAATEFGAGSRKYRALRDMNWFRVVLDEAHSIRNLATNNSKACCALNAERRWAVTGTPVQNALTDLGALIKFIRLSPFDESAAWSQHIMAPFKLGDSDVIEKLQVLVGSVTLRRMKNTIVLPERQEVIERLNFSSDEALLYKRFATKCRSQFNQVTGGGSALKGKAYAHVLKSLGRLRAICAHGREMLSEEDMKEIEGEDPSSAIVLDIGDEEPNDDFISEKQAYETFNIMQETEVDTCVLCRKKLGAETVRPDGAVDAEDEISPEASEEEDSEEEMDESDDLLGHLTTCYHLICSKCTDQHKRETQAQMMVDHFYHCPHCEQHQRYGMYPIMRSIFKQFRKDREGKTKKAKMARWDDNTYTGPHTKVKALLEDLRKSADESEAKEAAGEPPIRSVVFSGWTAYLDLIEHALMRNKIGFVRIDGTMSVKERSNSLKVFNTVKEVTVMLVSIRAGGQGLNFTAASNAYVMEPQFNPGVEEQAVDRIHRIGQTRDVKIVHYIMKESVEEGVLKLQKKKRALAKLSMEKKRSKNEEVRERMEELKALFK